MTPDEDRLLALAASINSHLGTRARVHTLQLVSYSRTETRGADDQRLRWQTVSADLDRYKSAVRRFTGDGTGAHAIRVSLIEDDYPDAPCWSWPDPSYAPSYVEDPAWIDYALRYEEETDKVAGGLNPPLDKKLRDWVASLELVFDDLHFSTFWVPQKHFDISQGEIVSHLFGLLRIRRPFDLPYSVIKACRDHIVNYVADYYYRYEDQQRRFRLLQLGRLLEDSARTTRILKEGSEAAAKILVLAAQSGIPLTISGPPGSGKTTTARTLCEGYIKEYLGAAPASYCEISCYDEDGALAQLEKLHNHGEISEPAIIDDIHVAGDRLRKRLEAFLVARRNQHENTLGSERAPMPVIATADHATPELCADGRFPKSLWARVSNLELQTQPFSELSEELKQRVAIDIISVAKLSIPKGTPEDIARRVINMNPVSFDEVKALAIREIRNDILADENVK